MANTKPTKIGPFKALKLVILFIFNSKEFIRKDESDNKHRESLHREKEIHRAYKLRRAFFCSLIVIIISGLIGFTIGYVLSYYSPRPNSTIITVLQIIGALKLLWATFALKGWDIQSFSGVTFTERVNRWIFRYLYFTGTLILIITMIWK